MKKQILALLLFISIAVLAQEKDVKYGQLGTLPRQDEAMQKWRNNRFGQFIHWGLYAIPGGIWDGVTYDYAAEFLKSSAKLTSATWDSLKYQFNPNKFNADEWALMAKKMGVKYATITTKHHEGFCLWPSKYTTFDIEATPYDKDLLGEFVTAYNKQGIDVNLYYSVLDWHHPAWRYSIKSTEDSVAFEELKQYTENQLLELLERYPSVKGLWFDGTWDKSWKENGQFSYELEKKLKEASPGLIVNSRMRADEYGSRHFDSNGELMGDYESGYERRLPKPWDTEVCKRDWECCMTIPYNQWGYHKDWTLSHVKSSVELLEMLSQCVSQNGNFLLNFGPNGQGIFRKEEIAIAKEIGQWIQENGEAIYGCTYAGLSKQDWGYFTLNPINKKLYMHIYNTPISGQYRIKLPKGSIIKSCHILGENKALRFAEIARDEYFITIKDQKRETPFVILIERDDSVSEKLIQKALI